MARGPRQGATPKTAEEYDRLVAALYAPNNGYTPEQQAAEMARLQALRNSGAIPGKMTDEQAKADAANNGNPRIKKIDGQGRVYWEVDPEYVNTQTATPYGPTSGGMWTDGASGGTMSPGQSQSVQDQENRGEVGASGATGGGGYGSFDAAPMDLIQSYEPAAPAGTMQGLDLTQQGAAEQWAPQNAASLAQPSASTNYLEWAMTPQGAGGTGRTQPNTMSWAPPSQGTGWQSEGAAAKANPKGNTQPYRSAGDTLAAFASGPSATGAASSNGDTGTAANGLYNEGGRLSSDTASADHYDANRDRYEGGVAASGAVNQAMAGMGKAGVGEGFAARAVGHYEGNTPEMSDYTGQNVNTLKSEMPDIATEPGFGAYYDRAKERTGTSLNKELGARGAYGSSVALGQLSDAYSGLDAEQANREADYNLSRLGEQRAWVTERGDASADADLASARRSGEERDWLSGLTSVAMSGDEARNTRNRDLANTALGYDQADLNRLNSGRDAAETVDQADLARLTTGGGLAQASSSADLGKQNLSFQAAIAAQDAQRTRGQDYFGNNLAMGNALSDTMGKSYADTFAGDKDLLDDEIAAQLGLTAEALSQDYRGDAADIAEQQRLMDDMAEMMAAWKAGQTA